MTDRPNDTGAVIGMIVAPELIVPEAGDLNHTKSSSSTLSTTTAGRAPAAEDACKGARSVAQVFQQPPSLFFRAGLAFYQLDAQPILFALLCW